MSTWSLLNSLSDWNAEGILSVLGTTASGKTRAVLDALNSKAWKNPLVVSVDSVAAYKCLDIGSAKPSSEEQREYSFAGLNLFEVCENIDAAAFSLRVKPLVQQALKENRPVLFVGGSHFYERFLVEGPAPGAASDPKFLEDLKLCGLKEVYCRLLKQEPRMKEKLHEQDDYRILRYADLMFRQKISFEELFQKKERATQWSVPVYRYIHSIERDQERINKRVDEMIEEGWVEEVEQLIDLYGMEIPALQCMGYFEWLEFFKKEKSFSETRDRICIRHGQLAKKQRTWLRGLMRLAK